MSLKRLILAALAAGAVGGVAACGDPLALTPATQPNRIDTVTIFALEGTPISAPSGFDVVFNVPARTDRAAGFDFTFDIDGDTSRIFPTGALGLGLERKDRHRVDQVRLCGGCERQGVTARGDTTSRMVDMSGKVRGVANRSQATPVA